MADLSVRCVIPSFYPRGVSRLRVGPLPGYRTSRKEHALPIVSDEFRPAIPRRVARQHCPPPLHRHDQHKTIAGKKGMIYHRTANSLLTVCLTRGDKRTCREYTPYHFGMKLMTLVTQGGSVSLGAAPFRCSPTKEPSGAR